MSVFGIELSNPPDFSKFTPPEVSRDLINNLKGKIGCRVGQSAQKPMRTLDGRLDKQLFAGSLALAVTLTLAGALNRESVLIHFLAASAWASTLFAKKKQSTNLRPSAVNHIASRSFSELAREYGHDVIYHDLLRGESHVDENDQMPRVFLYYYYSALLKKLEELEDYKTSQLRLISKIFLKESEPWKKELGEQGNLRPSKDLWFFEKYGPYPQKILTQWVDWKEERIRELSEIYDKNIRYLDEIFEKQQESLKLG